MREAGRVCHVMSRAGGGASVRAFWAVGGDAQLCPELITPAFIVCVTTRRPGELL